MVSSNVKLSDRDLRISELRRSGAKYQEIASELELNQAQVYQSLYKQGLVNTGQGRPGAGSKVTDGVRDAIAADRKQGLTYMALSMKYDLSTGVVNKVLREAGLVKHSTSTPVVAGAQSLDQRLASDVKHKRKEA